MLNINIHDKGAPSQRPAACRGACRLREGAKGALIGLLLPWKPIIVSCIGGDLGMKIWAFGTKISENWWERLGETGGNNNKQQQQP